MHTAILATKVGMTQVYDDNGNVQPVTVLEVGPCRVELLRTQERDGYDALQMSLERKGKTVARRESRIEPEARQYEIGEQLDAPFIEIGGKVDIIGTSKGRGFAGVMKRHNFAGQRASHGVKKCHRHPGSTGMSADPARVIKGTKMAGRYGGVKSTVRNLCVVRYDADRGILAVKGAVPGPNGGLVTVRQQTEA
ncbi:MAG: 50S ribosomal protein L3 [Planctomycetota bacterium]|nr:50S ribosomal protein L3 [Planctomycetota bacterium]MDA0920513.1 50S ribosomal protein L3 [Planctomycetota bacterium]